MLIDADTILSWKPCNKDYSSDRIRLLMDRPMTPIEILTRSDGLWSEVLSWHRIWVIGRRGIFDDKTCRLIMSNCSRRLLSSTSNPILHDACNVSRSFAFGKATVGELYEAEQKVWGIKNWTDEASSCWHSTRSNVQVAFEGFFHRCHCDVADIVDSIMEGLT